MEKTADESLKFKIMDPYLSVDFEKTKPPRTIGDFLKNLAECVNFYPDIPKDLAFGEYYTKTVKSANGYEPKRSKFQRCMCLILIERIVFFNHFFSI